MQQATTWTDLEQDPQRHMASLGHNKLNSTKDFPHNSESSYFKYWIKEFAVLYNRYSVLFHCNTQFIAHNISCKPKLVSKQVPIAKRLMMRYK